MRISTSVFVFTIKAIMGHRDENHGAVHSGKPIDQRGSISRCPQIGHKWNTVANAGSRK